MSWRMISLALRPAFLASFEIQVHVDSETRIMTG
jgi:hypothetical protein